MANRWGNSGNSDKLLFWGAPKITADGDCSHEVKRCLLLGRKVMTNLDSIFKSRDITLPTKVHLVKAMVFPVVMYGCESYSSSSLSAIRVVSSAYLRLLIFLPAILIPASFSLGFRMMYSAYKLNKQGDNIQPSSTPTDSPGPLFHVWF